MTKDSIQNISANSKKFLVVGDIMLDRYISGAAARISPEAPVPVLRYRDEKNILGGAANVATNLIGINQEVCLAACVGDDEAGSRIRSLLRDNNIDDSMVITVKDRPSTLKMRFVAGSQQLLRVDNESNAPLAEADAKRLLSLIAERIKEFSLVLISDYMKGVLSYDFTRKLIKLAGDNGVRVIVDVKDRDCTKYSHAWLLKPNRKELSDLTGMQVGTMDEVVEAMRALKKLSDAHTILATLSGDGMAFLDENDNVIFEKCDSRKVYDVVGAGDTAFAYVAAALVFGFEYKDMLRMANAASSIKVTRFGTAVVAIGEVIDELFHEAGKVQTIDTIENVLKNYRHKKIVFTNGCFDILHIGHIKYLKEAKARGDILVLGLNSDASVRRLKGESRPINKQQDRLDMLAEMEFIDYVVIFEEDTPYELITKVKPDILVKGGDYEADSIVGADFVRKNGGSVEIIPFVEGKSTTNIINAMKEKEAAK